MRGHLWRLGDNGGVDVADLPALGLHDADHMAQQNAAVGALELRIGVGEVFADVTQRSRAKQGIAQGVQQHVAIGMGQEAVFVGDTHPAQGNEITVAETVHIVAVANTHRKTP